MHIAPQRFDSRGAMMKFAITSPGIFMDTLNTALRRYGLSANCVLVTPGEGINFEGINFSRLSASQETLDHSFGSVMGGLGALSIALPRSYKTEGEVVNLVEGPGYSGTEINPNPSGMGLVMRANLVDTGLALGVTWADAPGAIVIHAPTGIVAAVSGIWTELSKGTVPKTLELMRQEIETMGHDFDINDIWVILSPGARKGFALNDAGREKLYGNGEDRVNMEFMADAYLTRVEGRERPWDLELAKLVHYMWWDAGVPDEQIHFDPRCTLTDVDEHGEPTLPSKRLADSSGRPEYSSGILAVLIQAV